MSSLKKWEFSIFILFSLSLILYAPFFVYKLHNVTIYQASTREYELKPITVPIDELMDGPYTLQQDDPRLKELILRDYVIAPSKEPYNINVTVDPSQGQGRFIRHLFKNKTNGVFVEVGALDGEKLSNTYILEAKLGWTGLLIEPSERYFQQLLGKHRKAWLSPLCLGTANYPEKRVYMSHIFSGELRKDKIDSFPRTSQVQCIPVYSILHALGMTEIDYFSLDIEGVELAVLKTLPWEKVKIAAFTIEHHYGDQTKEDIYNLMVSKGYVLYDPLEPEFQDWRMVENRIPLIDLVMYHPAHLEKALKKM